MFNINKDLETESSVLNTGRWQSAPFFKFIPMWLFQFADLTHPASSLLWLVSLPWKFSWELLKGFISVSLWSENQVSRSWQPWFSLGLSFPFKGMRLLVLICFHGLRQLLCSNWHCSQGDNCSLGISSLGPATCLARKPHQVGLTSFKCHYSKDLLNLCTLKWERHHREWKDGWQAWMNALVRLSVLDCHAFSGPDANI